MADDELDPMKCVARGFKRGVEAERKRQPPGGAKIEFTEDEICTMMRALIAVDRKNEASGTAYEKLSAAWAKLQPRQKPRKCGCRTAGHELCSG